MIDAALRDKTACQMRIRNEEKWIRRSLERTFQVARQVVLWDDGSEDNTLTEALLSILPSDLDRIAKFLVMPSPFVVEYNDCVLHILRSPFRYNVVRSRQAVDEIRDKNCTWAYMKSSVDFDYVLALDGDEILTLEAIRNWPSAIMQLRSGIDILHLPFVYAWDAEDRRRVDGIYGDIPGSSPPLAKLNFPRLSTILRVDEKVLYQTVFQWFGTQWNMHCGSVARQNFRPLGTEPTSAIAYLPILHLGYVSEELRQKKYIFYNEQDPENDAEGRYLHTIGKADVHAPGPLEFVTWKDV
jgi:hypothetical protein